MKSLVIGYGSIGARHARVLSGLGCDTAVVSSRNVDFPQVYSELIEAIDQHAPEYVVIANKTAQHHNALSLLATLGFSGQVLVEKPIFEVRQPLCVSNFKHVAVAYNMRFHPLIRKLRALVDGRPVLSVHAYVGQYLPDWRPNADYRSSYSASLNEGGGVLRDLSHELDYLVWLFGEWKALTALGGHLSGLEINSEDLFVLLMQTSGCAAMTAQLSYLDRQATRRLIVNTQTTTVQIDLIDATISVDGKMEVLTLDRDYSYAEMHRAYLSGDMTSLCSIEEALRTLDLIDQVEHANLSRSWVVQ